MTARPQPRARNVVSLYEVFDAIPQPAHMPCVDCGASVARNLSVRHVCEAERVHSFRLFAFRDEISAFDLQLAEWLSSTPGRFAVWVAEHDRLH